MTQRLTAEIINREALRIAANFPPEERRTKFTAVIEEPTIYRMGSLDAYAAILWPALFKGWLTREDADMDALNMPPNVAGAIDGLGDIEARTVLQYMLGSDKDLIRIDVLMGGNA